VDISRHRGLTTASLRHALMALIVGVQSEQTASTWIRRAD